MKPAVHHNRPAMPAAMPPFISDELNIGDPSFSRKDLGKPKLRKFAQPPSSLRWNRFLGAGEDGFVISATMPDGSAVAVKFVWDPSYRVAAFADVSSFTIAAVQIPCCDATGHSRGNASTQHSSP